MCKLYLRVAIILLGILFETSNSAAATGPFALLHSLFDPGTNAQGGVQQGYSVAIDGNFAVVGAPFDAAGANASGVAKVYDATTFVLLFTLTNPIPAADDIFGCAVAISGTRVVVGACGDDTGRYEAGSAYVYDLASANPTVPMLTLTNPAPSNDLIGDAFGAAVAISGTRLVIGVSRSDIPTYNAGIVYVYDLTSAISMVPSFTLTNPSPVSGDSFGSSVAISGTRVVVGAYYDDMGATDVGTAYVYDLALSTPTTSVLTLTNPIPAPNGRFGSTVAISGTRVVVGAPSHRTGMSPWGIAHVFDLVSARPSAPVTTLINPNPTLADNFGSVVSVSGTRVVVGAHWNDTGASSAGIAYVYDMARTTPSVPAITLTNPYPAALDHFGYSVAVSGTRVLIGAPDDDAKAVNAGGAYLFDLARSNPTVPRGTLNAAVPAPEDRFGASVAVAGTRIVVGAPGDDKGALNAGSVYVYDFASHATMLTLTNPSPGESDAFGYAVAMSGSRVVVGAPYDGAGAANAGSAYIYDLAGAMPSVPVFTLTNPNPAGDWFGYCVAISGTRVAIGAPYNSIEGIQDGGAYVYDLASVTPTQPIATLTGPCPWCGARFGYSVAVSGTRVVVGASPAGAYLFELASDPLTVTRATLNPASTLADGFGMSVAISSTRVVVGAPYDDTVGYNAGSVYFFDLASATPDMPVSTLTNPSVGTGAGFGSAVALSGARVVIGKQIDNAGGLSSGVAYVYDLAGFTPATPAAVLLNPSPAAWDNFGNSVAIDGATVAVGSPYDDTTGRDRGTAYIFGITPALSIVPTVPGLATLSWTPSALSGFVLQYSESLAPTNWINAPSAETNPVTLSLTNTARFYRLRGP